MVLAMPPQAAMSGSTEITIGFGIMLVSLLIGYITRELRAKWLTTTATDRLREDVDELKAELEQSEDETKTWRQAHTQRLDDHLQRHRDEDIASAAEAKVLAKIAADADAAQSSARRTIPYRVPRSE
jgi:hypothetical protein